MKFPPPLTPGARVALIAPAGPLRAADELDRAKANVTSLGWEPVPARHALDADGYLAGTDADRVRDINDAIRDHTINAIWCLRGGYGTMRLLPAIDYRTLTRFPKPIIGYSDITAIHAAFNRYAEVATFHGPTARQTLPDFSRHSLVRALTGTDDPCGAMPNARTLTSGRADGRLAGGNLALLAALAGTDYAPDYKDAIVIIEDVNEAHYRIDRMLTQLRLADAFRECAGIVFGGFSDIPKEYGDETWTLDRVLEDVAQKTGVPCVAGAPFGHIDEQWTIPLGAHAELDADACTLKVIRT
jgi:muramoyltetrapeptide carboxypeptidase